MIREVANKDIPAICHIYNYYIANTIITFEYEPVDVEEMTRRIEEIKTTLPFIVYESEGGIKGFAYASKWKGRCAYQFSVETTVYTDKDSMGRGIGTALYTALLDDLRQRKFHAAIAGISLPNEPSRKLHEKFGFEKVAQFKEVGYKFNKWIDVGYWELILNPL